MENVDEFVTHLERLAGESLRSVAVYGPETYRELYVREDVRAAHEAYDTHERMAERFRAEASERDEEEWAFMDGTLGATVRVFTEAVVLHLPRDERHGTVVSLDPAAAGALVDFVAECRADLYG